MSPARTRTQPLFGDCNPGGRASVAQCLGFRGVARLVLINGAPGSGKSTLAEALAQVAPNVRVVDIDAIKHTLPNWDDDPAQSGREARRRALAEARTWLLVGCDIVVGQYLARTEFIADLQQLADDVGAEFKEIILDLDEETLAVRLSRRSAAPSRPEHLINNDLVTSEDAHRLAASITTLRESRTDAILVDARGSRSATLALLRVALDEPACAAEARSADGVDPG